MNVGEVEKSVLEVEGVVIKIRAKTSTDVGDFDYQKQAGGSTSVSHWLEKRISPLLDGHEVSIIDGNYEHPHGRTLMKTLRSSYER